MPLVVRVKRKTVLLIVLILLGFALIFAGQFGFKNSHQGSNQEKINQPARQVSVEQKKDKVISTTSNDLNMVPFPSPIEQSGVSKLNRDSSASPFFVECRLQRERMRGQQIELLREIINNPDSLSSTREKAQERLLKISQNIQQEVELENLLKAKGYQDAILLLEEKGITALVQARTLPNEEMYTIVDLVSRKTGIEPSQVMVLATQ